MGLKKNIGIYFPFFYNHINLYKSFKQINYKSWHYLNYLVRNSYNLFINDSFYNNNNFNLYINNDVSLFNQLSDISCNILSLVNKFHRVIKYSIYDLDYSISSNFSDWNINNNLLYLVNNLFLNYSLLINSYDTDVILSPQSYFKYKYWINLYNKLFIFNFNNLLLYSNINIYFNILKIFQYYLFNIFIFNLNRFIIYDLNLQKLFKLIYFKFFIKWINKYNLKINYYLFNIINLNNLWNNNLFLLINLLNLNKNKINYYLFKKLYLGILYKKSLNNNINYYLFKKLFNKKKLNSFKYSLFDIFCWRKKNIKLFKFFNKNYLLKNIWSILYSNKEEIFKKTVDYYVFFWKERIKFSVKFKIINKLLKSNTKIYNLYSKFNYINYHIFNNHNIFKSYIVKRLPRFDIYYISKNLIYGRKLYSGILFPIRVLNSFFLYTYTIKNLKFTTKFFIDFFNLFLIIFKNNIVINFKLDNFKLYNYNINIYMLLYSYFKFTYNYINNKQKNIKINYKIFYKYFINLKYLFVKNIFKNKIIYKYKYI